MTAQTPLRWARAAAIVAVTLLVIKVVAAWLTGSRAVFSDAAESVVNGRHNWGLPKRQARFETVTRSEGQETVKVQLSEHAPLTLSFTRRGPALPMRAGILPRAWRCWSGGGSLGRPKAPPKGQENH